MKRGDTVILRDVREADLPVFFEQQRDPEACLMAAFPSRELDAFLLHWRTNVLGNPAARKRTIVAGERVVGNIGSWDADGMRLVGYWIGRDCWGRGIATAALSEFLREEVTRPLFAFVASHNAGSIRVLQKCGFREVDRHRVSDEIEEALYRLDGAGTA